MIRRRARRTRNRKHCRVSGPLSFPPYYRRPSSPQPVMSRPPSQLSQMRMLQPNPRPTQRQLQPRPRLLRLARIGFTCRPVSSRAPLATATTLCSGLCTRAGAVSAAQGSPHNRVSSLHPHKTPSGIWRTPNTASHLRHTRGWRRRQPRHRCRRHSRRWEARRRRTTVGIRSMLCARFITSPLPGTARRRGHHAASTAPRSGHRVARAT